MEDFFPINLFDYLPIFELDYSGEEKEDVETLFDAAREKFDNEDYEGAKADYKQLIDLYPTSNFANAGMKELFALEQFEANDYGLLKEYYLSNSNIVNDSSLAKLGDFLANRCDIKLENYPTAITWFEDRIQNPPSFADSIYSIIDLGDTYLLMENGGSKSSSYIGSMPQYKPENPIKHQKTTQYLLSLLPGPKDNMTEELKDKLNSLKAGELSQNIPNPFKGSTDIYYKLDANANVDIKVYNSIGQLVKTIYEGVKEKGTYSTEFNADGLVNGMYFYSIQVNGKQTDTKKMNLVR